MIFERLAKFVIKRYLIIIVAWIVVLFYSVPLIASVDDVIAYQETEFLSKEFESHQAQYLIEEQFPRDSANSSVLLVIVGENLASSESRDFILELTDSIRSRPDLKYLDEVISIYDVYEQSIVEISLAAAPLIYQTEEQAALSLQMLFEIPDGFFEAFEGVNLTASIVYGIPSTFFQYWLNDSEQNDSIKDLNAYAFTRSYLDNYTQMVDPLNATLMDSYFEAFNGSWEYLGKNSSYAIDPNLRLEQSVDLAIESLKMGLPPGYESATAAIDSIRQNLSFSDYYDPIPQSNLAAALVESTIYLGFGNETGIDTAVILLYDTNETWKNSFDNLSDISIQERTENVTGDIYSSFLSRFSNLSEEFLFLSSLISSFNETSYGDTGLIHQFAVSLIGGSFQITDPGFIEAIYAMGPNPALSGVEPLANEIVRNGTIATYPVPLPPGILDSFISSDNSTMIVTLAFTREATFREGNGYQPIIHNVDILREIGSEAVAQHNSVTLYVTGEAPISADLNKATTRDLELIEPVTIILIIVLMSFFFRSILTPFVPLGSIGIALGLSQAMVFIIGAYVAQVHFTVLTILIAILFGVGTDYSIFILARYREERIKGENKEEAMRKSITWAGESITTSGATVIISFSVLSLSSFGMLKSMGIVISLAVLISLLVSLTLIPAITLLLGGKIFWPASGKRWKEFRIKYLKKRAMKKGGYFRHAARISVKHPWAIFITALLISVPTTYVFLNQETSFDLIGGMAESESIDGINALSDSFGAGRISPTSAVIQFQADVLSMNGSFDFEILDLIEEISSDLSTFNNLYALSSPTRPNGVLVDYGALSSMNTFDGALLMQQMTSMIGMDNRTVLFSIVFVDEPYTPISMDSIGEIRLYFAGAEASEPLLQGATILVGGESAGVVDVDELTGKEFTNMQIMVIIGVFIVLFIVLGSVLLPLFAILSIGLSISWTIATTLLIFDFIFQKPILWMLPIVLFIVLMGLGMDYNIFILTRIREEMQKRGNHVKAIVEAVDRTGGIITACAIIMAGAFGSMMLSSTTMLQEFGFALSFAVLLDAMLVRTYLTPAIMVILGPKWTWWAPGRLQRVKLDEETRKHRPKLPKEFDEEL